MDVHDSSDDDAIEKDVAYLVKNFQKFLKFKNSDKFGDKGKFQSLGREKSKFKKKDGKESQFTQGVTYFECNEHGHFKKECPNYLKLKGKVYATTRSDSDSSNSDSDESCDKEGNYSAFMTIAHVESSEDLNLLVQELGEHSDEESIGIVEESDVEEDKNAACLQENYNSLLEKSGEYARVAKAVVKKMKKAEEDYRSLLMRHKEAKYEIQKLNGELSEAYTKTRFLEPEVVQANAKIKRVSTKKLNDVISSEKQFSDKSRLGYPGGNSSSGSVTKEVKFIKAKEQLSVGRSESRAKSYPQSQRGPRSNYVCHHCGLQGHTRPNCQKLRAMNNASARRS